MTGQQEFKIKDSKIIQIGFCKCKDCELEDIYISDAETGDPICRDVGFEED